LPSGGFLKKSAYLAIMAEMIVVQRFLSGLGFLVKLCLGDMLRAIEEFMAKRIEIFLRESGHCPWRLDLKTGLRHADQSD
jgi:hypothetical protein